MALFIADKFAERAHRFLRSELRPALVSDLATAEFASALSRLVRMHELARTDAGRAFGHFDMWALQPSRRVRVVPSDIDVAEAYLRRLDLNLRTMDAIHVAASSRLGAELVTFDTRMADVARVMGVAVAEV